MNFIWMMEFYLELIKRHRNFIELCYFKLKLFEIQFLNRHILSSSHWFVRHIESFMSVVRTPYTAVILNRSAWVNKKIFHSSISFIIFSTTFQPKIFFLSIEVFLHVDFLFIHLRIDCKTNVKNSNWKSSQNIVL